MNRSGEMIIDLLGDELYISDTETMIELNFAMVKNKNHEGTKNMRKNKNKTLCLCGEKQNYKDTKNTKKNRKS
jgi:hypothetical protein